MNDSAFVRAADAFLFFLQTASEDDVRVVRGFGHKEIHNAKEFQFLESFLRELRIRKRDERIEAAGKQCLDFAAMNRFHDFDSRITRLGNFVRSDAPYFSGVSVAPQGH